MMQFVKVGAAALVTRAVVREGITIYQDYQEHKARLDIMRAKKDLLKEMIHSDKVKITQDSDEETSESRPESEVEVLTEVFTGRVKHHAGLVDGFFSGYAEKFKPGG